jgi:hypothetical protein
VKLGGKTLTKGTDYTVLYNGSETAPKTAGSYTVTIKGKGSYSGTKSVGTMRLVSPPALSSSKAYKIVSSYSASYVLDAAGTKPKKGANVSIWTWNNGSNQKWYFVPDGKGYYTIKSAANTGYVLDAAGTSPSQGSNVSVWTNKNDSSLNQKWVIESAGSGQYVFRNAANPNLVLDASGKKPKVGANVTTWTWNSGTNQKWKLTAL